MNVLDSVVGLRRLSVAAACVAIAAAAVAAPSPKLVSVEKSPARGSVDAKLVVVEFSDFQCPSCGQFVRATFAQIDERYIASGKIRFVFRHFPIEEAHPNAFNAAVAAECANNAGKFWEMHDRLFANQQALSKNDLQSYAKAIGIDESAFQRCLDGSAKGRVRRDFNDGLKAGVIGTPTFFIGVPQDNSKVRIVKTLNGIPTASSFGAVIDQLLASTDGPPAARR